MALIHSGVVLNLNFVLLIRHDSIAEKSGDIFHNEIIA